MRPRIDQARAAAALRRRRFSLSGLRRHSRPDPSDTELVWLRYLLVQAPLIDERWQSASCLVCATTGTAWAVEVEAQRFIEPSDPVAPAVLPRAQLEEAGLRHLRSRAARAGRGGPLPRLSQQIDVEEWALPYWVLILERRGRLDFRALDAITGDLAGGAVRQALVASLLAR